MLGRTLDATLRDTEHQLASSTDDFNREVSLSAAMEQEFAHLEALNFLVTGKVHTLTLLPPLDGSGPLQGRLGRFSRLSLTEPR